MTGFFFCFFFFFEKWSNIGLWCSTNGLLKCNLCNPEWVCVRFHRRYLVRLKRCDWLTDWLTDWFFQYTHSNQSNSIRFDWDWKISLKVNESTLDLPRTDAVGGPIRAGIYASPPPIRQITAKASLTHMAPCPIKLNWIKLNSHQIHQQSQFINNGCNNDSFTTMIHNINSY